MLQYFLRIELLTSIIQFANYWFNFDTIIVEVKTPMRKRMRIIRFGISTETHTHTHTHTEEVLSVVVLLNYGFKVKVHPFGDCNPVTFISAFLLPFTLI